MDMLESPKMVKHKAKGKDLNSDKVSFCSMAPSYPGGACRVT